MPIPSHQVSTCTANGSFSSNRPMSSSVRPVCSSTRFVAGIGPMPISSGSTPANANATRRIFGARPSSRAVSSAARNAAVAPSVRPAELPAVTRPPARNGARRFARPSMDVSGRRNSSRSAAFQPSSVKTLIGTTVPRMTPFCHAAAARCCERTAYASASRFVMCGKRSCRFSAVAPMVTADASTSRSATKRGLKSTSSAIGWWPMCSTPPARTTSQAP